MASRGVSSRSGATTRRSPSAAASYSAVKDQLVSLSLEIEVRFTSFLNNRFRWETTTLLWRKIPYTCPEKHREYVQPVQFCVKIDSVDRCRLEHFVSVKYNGLQSHS